MISQNKKLYKLENKWCKEANKNIVYNDTLKKRLEREEAKYEETMAF